VRRIFEEFVAGRTRARSRGAHARSHPAAARRQMECIDHQRQRRPRPWVVLRAMSCVRRLQRVHARHQHRISPPWGHRVDSAPPARADLGTRRVSLKLGRRQISPAVGARRYRAYVFPIASGWMSSSRRREHRASMALRSLAAVPQAPLSLCAKPLQPRRSFAAPIEDMPPPQDPAA